MIYRMSKFCEPNPYYMNRSLPWWTVFAIVLGLAIALIVCS